MIGKLLTVMILSVIFFGWNNVSAQRVESDVSLSATGGYASNSYLVSGIPLWDRRYNSLYSAISPGGSIRVHGRNRSFSLRGRGNLLQFSDDREAWFGGNLAATYREQVLSTVSLQATGGADGISADYNREMVWLQIGAQWFISPFMRVDASAGTGRWAVSDFGEDSDMTDRFSIIGLSVEYWPDYRWRLQAGISSNIDNITNPKDGFTGTISASRFTRRGTVLTLRSGLEHYSSEYVMGTGTEAATVSGQSVTDHHDMLRIHQQMASGDIAEVADETGGGVLRLEDQFYRTMVQVTHPVSSRVTVTGTVSGLLWLSSQDDHIEPDFQVSAGVRIPFSVSLKRKTDLRSVSWESKEPGNAVISVRYSKQAELYITGNFNNWEEPGVRLYQTSRNEYRAELDLQLGVHEFKIGKKENGSLEWLELPDDAETVSDGFGGRNGRVFIDN